MHTLAYYELYILQYWQHELVKDLEMKRQIRETRQSKANRRPHFLRRMMDWLCRREPARKLRLSNLAKGLNY